MTRDMTPSFWTRTIPAVNMTTIYESLATKKGKHDERD